jgi:hypothetical protein
MFGQIVPPMIRTSSQHPETILALQLAELAARVRRLLPSHRDPEAFHLEKDEIAHQLRRLADKASRSTNLQGRA